MNLSKLKWIFNLLIRVRYQSVVRLFKTWTFIVKLRYLMLLSVDFWQKTDTTSTGGFLWGYPWINNFFRTFTSYEVLLREFMYHSSEQVIIGSGIVVSVENIGWSKTLQLSAFICFERRQHKWTSIIFFSHISYRNGPRLCLTRQFLALEFFPISLRYMKRQFLLALDMNLPPITFLIPPLSQKFPQMTFLRLKTFFRL